MAEWLGRLPLFDPVSLALVYVVAVGAAVLLVRRPPGPKRWWRRVTGAAVVGAAVGAVTTWIVCDVVVMVDVPPTVVDRVWIAVLFAALAVAVANVGGTPRRRKLLAVVGVVSFVVATGAAVNRDAGAYTTLGQVVGVPQLKTMATTPGRARASTGGLDATWVPPSETPSRGKVGEVSIPGTVSGFPARHAIVYLPPAALVRHPPALPVVILLGGQPGTPEQVFTSTRLRAALDALAGSNRGLAPVVVVPDQLGTTHPNPMCVDGALGNSATYVTVDVTAWIHHHLPVAPGHRQWAIGGFSQGGTCALQFAARRPDLYGAFIDVAGEPGPTLGSRAASIANGFGGDATAFENAQPVRIMEKHGRYRDSTAFFGVGQQDAQYARDNRSVISVARSVGMSVATYTSPGSGHDWTTASRSFIHGIGLLYPRFGLARTPQSLSPAAGG